VPVAQADTDGSLLTRASKQSASQTAGTLGVSQVSDDGTLLTRASQQAAKQRPVQINPGYVTDGTLLSRAGQQAALRELARTNPGRVSDGMLLTRASLVYQLSQLDPGYGTGESIVSETAAARNAAQAAAGGRGFHWGDAAAGFGLAAFVAGLLGVGALMVRRHGTLVHSQ
jgi:hypothetical protein